MEIEKIEIQTSNKKHATDIAMLVDKLEFLQEIKKLRKKWQVTSLYRTSDFDGFLTSNVHTKYAKPKEPQKRLVEFNDDIDELLKKFHRGRNFKKVIEYALVTGIIPEGIYQSCYFDIVTINEPEDLAKPEKYQYVIIISPRTEKQEVEQAFSEFEKHIRGYEPTNEFRTGILGKINFHNSANNYTSEIPIDRELIEQYHKGNIYTSSNTDKFKTQKELNRTREWYWIAYSDKFNSLSNKRMRSEDILDEWQKDCPLKTNHVDVESKSKCSYCAVENVNDVDHALSAYVKLLKQS